MLPGFPRWRGTKGVELTNKERNAEMCDPRLSSGHGATGDAMKNFSPAHKNKN